MHFSQSRVIFNDYCYLYIITIYIYYLPALTHGYVKNVPMGVRYTSQTRGTLLSAQGTSLNVRTWEREVGLCVSGREKSMAVNLDKNKIKIT